MGVFVKKYAGKRRVGWDPNDRQYDREVEALVKRMSPEALDELMNGGPSDDEPLLVHRRKRG